MNNITIKEIAKECQVSLSTVSNVINGKPKVSEKTRKRILEVMEKTGYQPNLIAQGLRKQRTNTIGIIVEDIAQFTTPPIIEGVMSICEQFGYRTVVQNLRLYSRWQHLWFDDEKMVESVLDPAIQEFRNIMVDGIVYIAGHGRKIHFPEKLEIPVVLCYAYSEDADIPSIVLDDEESSYELASYLIKKGHTKIGVLAGASDNLHTGIRMTGIQRAFYDGQVLFNPQMVSYAGWYKEHGYENAGKMIEQGVTAIICMNDRVAGGVYQYCYEKGIRIGEDLAVVGFDNEIESNYYTPALTTMALPLKEIGEEAARVLNKKLEESEQNQERDDAGEEIKLQDLSEENVAVTKLPAKLLERESVQNQKK